MSGATIHPDLLVVLPGFVPRDRNDELVAFLEQAPVATSAGHRPEDAFSFTAPVVDGAAVVGRREACAGWPVWNGQGPAEGARIPSHLALLADEVRQALTELREPALGDPATTLAFTSVYADRYPRGGTFFPHTDRSCYGDVVAGVSLGTGSSRLVFRRDGQVETEVALGPGSLYAFAGHLRAEPCTHEIVDVDDVRYGITYRTAAAGLPIGSAR